MRPRFTEVCTPSASPCPERDALGLRSRSVSHAAVGTRSDHTPALPECPIARMPECPNCRHSGIPPLPERRNGGLRGRTELDCRVPASIVAQKKVTICMSRSSNREPKGYQGTAATCHADTTKTRARHVQKSNPIWTIPIVWTRSGSAPEAGSYASTARLDRECPFSRRA